MVLDVLYEVLPGARFANFLLVLDYVEEEGDLDQVVGVEFVYIGLGLGHLCYPAYYIGVVLQNLELLFHTPEEIIYAPPTR